MMAKTKGQYRCGMCGKRYGFAGDLVQHQTRYCPLRAAKDPRNEITTGRSTETCGECDTRAEGMYTTDHLAGVTAWECPECGEIQEPPR